MPELPEVETIRRQLEHELIGSRITSIDAPLPKMIRGGLRLLKRRAVGRQVEGVGRRGKYLLWYMAGGWTIIIHLKMTGQLIYRRGATMHVGGHPIPGGAEGLPNKYSHVIFSFPRQARVYFNDQRQFGFVEAVRTDDLDTYFAERRMGPEPLGRSFTETFFCDVLTRRSGMTIKQLLLDQTAIAGIGNIYALESLYDAGIRPQRRASSITQAEAQRLYRSIKKVLRAAIKAQGSSSENYVDAYGQPGRYKPQLKVYGRGGEACGRCGTTIRRITLGGRGTTYCPYCQR